MMMTPIPEHGRTLEFPELDNSGRVSRTSMPGV